MEIIKTIQVDIADRDHFGQQRVYAKQYDANTRKIAVSLYASGVAWTIPSGAKAVIRFRKEDGTGGIYDKLPDNTSAYSVSSNEVTITLAPEVLTAAGTVSADVVLVLGTQALATFNFFVSVERSPSAGVTPSNNYYNYQTLADINAAIDALMVARDDANNALAGKLDANQGAGNAGKYLRIGSDGVITPVPAPSGGAGGVSPTISISSITGGHRVTVTDADGSRFFDVMDGADGAGGVVSVNGEKGNLVLPMTLYGTCSSDAASTVKVVSGISEQIPVVGTVAHVAFAQANTAAEPRLLVPGYPNAYPIVDEAMTGYVSADAIGNRVHKFVFSSGGWILMDPANATGSVEVDTTLSVSGIAADAKAAGDALAGKLNANQGTGNAGKYLGIGSDGAVTPVDAPTGGNVELDTTLSTSGKAADAKAAGDALAGKLSKSGGTMTGKISMGGNIIAGAGSVDSTKYFIGEFSDISEYSTNFDGTYGRNPLCVSTDQGGYNLVVGGGKIGGLTGTPSNNDDAANKKYVDDVAAGKLSANQGTANAGKYLEIGSDGAVTPVAKPKGGVTSVNGMSGNVTLPVLILGTCSTGASDATKVVVITGASGDIPVVVYGTVIRVKFSNANTAYGIKLSVPGVPNEYPVIDSSMTGVVAPNAIGNRIHTFVFKMGAWVLLDPANESGTVDIDTTLSVSGKAADAKAVGNALAGKLSKSGGTMTGKLSMGGNIIEGAGSVDSTQYYIGGSSVIFESITNLDGTYGRYPLRIDTDQGDYSLIVGGGKIGGLTGTPSNSDDAANKKYVDEKIPTPTDSDNGKFLRVVDGVATWTTVPNAEGASF